MAKRKSAPLNAGLLVRKGEAAPATDSKPIEVKDTTPPLSEGTKPVSLTVKLDPGRYHRLLGYGARFTPRRTNQDIVVDALDEFFERHG